MIYVMDGELTQHFETGSFRYQKGDACLLNRRMLHNEGLETDCRLAFLNLQPDFVTSLYQAPSLLPGVSQCPRGAIYDFFHDNYYERIGSISEYMDFPCTLQQRSGQASAISIYLEKLIFELEHPSIGYTYRILATLLNLFEELETPDHYHCNRTKVNAHPEELILARMIQYLKEKNGRVSRDELEQILHYNGDYLNRISKKLSGMTLSHLSQKIAVDIACEALVNTDATVGAIIQNMGYTNRTHFYKIFEQQTGCSMKEYREKNR